MKGWRNTTEHLRRGSTRRTHSHIGVTLQTYKTNFMPGQHPRIRRSMRLVACSAPFQSHGRVLERKGSALIGVALQAAGLIPGECSNHLGRKLPCGLWQSTQDMAPCGSLCAWGRWNWAHAVK